MEFVGALKSSLLREFVMKSKQEDFYNSATVATCVPSEDFSVDDLLDLSNPELEDGYVVEDEEEQEPEQEQEQEHEQDEEEKDSLSDSSSQDQADEENSNSTNSSASADSDSHLTSGLAVPDDDLADLEWVSHLLDDSVSEFSLSYPAGEQKAETRLVNGRHELETRPALKRKARSKRARPTGRVWSFGSSLNQSSPTTSSSTGFSSTPCLIFNSAVQTMDLFHSLGEPPFKKQKKKPAVQTGGVSGGIQFQRRCTHCQVQKTPQWRTGPLGAKTLCNACGVRYKSGRLYPEYRPACSPTFLGEIHSNSHRKVLEMRKRKETVAGPESGLMQMVQSF